ncbi:MAG: hypothetical protein QE570_10480 [Verrucomicrobiota bacterium]|nr:hypothetical protein [Verrucomicrobiota bacterium]
MPYDPQWPQNGQNIDADRFRGQFAGIIDLIGNGSGINAAKVDSTNTLPPSTPANASVSVVGNTLHFTFEIPQGQEGLTGPAGPPFASAVVDSVTTLNPGESATVGVSFDGTNVRFTFDIPRGNDGSQGQPGNNGSDGGQGPQGAQGPPFAQAIVDGVTTLDPGQQATVQTSFDGSNVRFTFGIPRGSDGSNGSDGSQGPPGEISQAQLNSAISGTSANTNSVSTLDTGFADPDMEALRQKLNEMILNGRR